MTSAFFFRSLITWFLVSSLFVVFSEAILIPVEQDTLLSMKGILDPKGTSGIASSWIRNTDCSDWAGVRCLPDSGNVFSINLSNLQLSGSIPSSVTTLSYLRILNLSFNQLSGTIPDSIGKLGSVISMDLSSNSLSGTLPSSIGSMAKLSILVLSNNQFSGSIPSSIGDLTYLTTVYFNGNLFSGAIPISFNKQTSLGYFYASDNFFTGTVPPFCTTAQCELSNNCFEGTENQRPLSQCVTVIPPPPPPISLPVVRSKLIPLENTPRNHFNPYFRYGSFGFDGSEDNPNWKLSAKVDWREYTDIGSVVNQDTCFACWTMAPIASVECLLSITGLGWKSLSAQQILDCQGRNDPCKGGWPLEAFEYLASNGVARSLNYPWISGTQKCKAKPSSVYREVKIAMYEEVDFYGSFGLILAVQNQPVIVNIQSTSIWFQNYTSGVMDREECFTSMVDHTVLVIGYSLFGDFKPYWIIRNSWGPEWGESGYMKLAYTGGFGICGIHTTPAYYPVLPFQVSSMFPTTDNPCGYPNPCGGGTCSIDPLTKLNKCTNCPELFLPVTNLDGTQSCAPLQVCDRKAVNPCGVGTCVNDNKGSYTCICPRGYNQTFFSDVRQNTCIEGNINGGVKSLIYVVQGGDTCSLIAFTFGLDIQKFLAQNKQIDCTKLSPYKTRVNVTGDPQYSGCAVKYSWSKGDNCFGIASLLGIQLNVLYTLNPGLDCNNVVPGTQICVKNGVPPERTPPCGKYQSVTSSDDCFTITRQFKLNIFTFLLYNPGINCKSLVPQTKSASISGQTVCVEGLEPYGQARKKCANRSYIVKKYDTCAALIYKYFRQNIANFKAKNFGFNCFARRLKVGESICI